MRPGVTWMRALDASIRFLDEHVPEQAADQAVEHDRLGEREAEPLDALQLTAELGLARDRLDHRAEDVADADSGAERAEAYAEGETDGFTCLGHVAGGGSEKRGHFSS